MKKRIFLLLKAALFAALLTAAVAYVSGVTERKASRDRLGPFLAAPKEYDVLFLGDSLMVNAVFPMELFADYGLAAYNMASYGNTLPVSYWSLMLALDVADPQLVVLDVSGADRMYKLSGSSSDVHTALDCYPLSRTKLRAIGDLMDDPEAMDDEGNRYADIRWEYIFKLGKYHERWKELKRSDFFWKPNPDKGGTYAVGVADAEPYDLIDDEQAFEENDGWGYVYLRKIIETCQNRGIEILLTNLPYLPSERDQMRANTIYAIAEEYGVPYINFLSLDQVVDYATDGYDGDGHLNPSGARKATDYLGRYISDHYDLKDRRQDPAYAHWHAIDAQYEEKKADFLRGERNPEKLAMLLHDDSFSVCLALAGGLSQKADGRLLTLIQNIAREHVYEADLFAKWSNSLFPLEMLEEAVWSDEPYTLIVDRKTGEITECAGGAPVTADTSFGRVERGEDDLLLNGKHPFDAQADMQVLVIGAQTGEVIAAHALALPDAQP